MSTAHQTLAFEDPAADAPADQDDVRLIPDPDRVRLLLPGKPQTGSFRFTKGGQRYTPRTVAEWRGYVRAAIADLVQEMIPARHPVEVYIIVRKPRPKSHPRKANAKWPCPWAWVTKPDCDNVTKPLWDALKAIAFADDAQVTDLIVRKRWGEREEIEISVRELQEGDVV
jgi:Holliday junction resolvase RusA-like endonuclease